MSKDAQNDERQKLVELAARLKTEAREATLGMSDEEKRDNPVYQMLLAAFAGCKWHYERNGTLLDLQVDVLAAACATVAHAIELREGCDCPRCRMEAMGKVLSGFAAGLAGDLGIEASAVFQVEEVKQETLLQ